MSGILAILHRDGRPVDAAVLNRLADTMAEAGPDGLDSWTDGEVGMAVASFHTVPEQVGEPAPLVDGDLAIAFDGRIDNRDDVRSACAAHGVHVAKTAGDASHVLAAYRLWGDQVAATLIGEHAFVLWDRKARRVLGVRDHMAVRSLRWWSDGRTLIVSSHFAPILAHPDVRPRPNEGAVAEWLCNMVTSIDESLWDGVYSLPGGGQLLAGRDRAPRVERYWRPQDELEQRPIRSPGAAREMLVELTTEAVRCRMRAVGRPLVELSGGWDSSTVAVVAHDLQAAGAGPDFELYAALYPGFSCDETPWIEAVERQLGRHAVKQSQDVPDPAGNEATIRRLRHPYAYDPLRRIPVSSERRVGLTGDAGDEVLGGMFYDLGSLLDPRRLPHASRSNGLRELLHDTLRPVVRPLLPRGVRAARLPPPPPWVSPELLRRVSFRDRIAGGERTTSRGGVRARQLAGLLDSSTFHLQDLLGELERGTYLEYRHPLLDVRLVRLALALPARIAGAFDLDPRRLHDQAFGRRLPPTVRERRLGADFTPYMAATMRAERSRHRGCPRLVAEGWLIGSRVEPLDLLADAPSGIWRARLAYSVDAWHAT